MTSASTSPSRSAGGCGSPVPHAPLPHRRACPPSRRRTHCHAGCLLRATPRSRPQTRARCSRARTTTTRPSPGPGPGPCRHPPRSRHHQARRSSSPPARGTRLQIGEAYTGARGQARSCRGRSRCCTASCRAIAGGARVRMTAGCTSTSSTRSRSGCAPSRRVGKRQWHGFGWISQATPAHGSAPQSKNTAGSRPRGGCSGGTWCLRGIFFISRIVSFAFLGAARAVGVKLLLSGLLWRCVFVLSFFPFSFALILCVPLGDRRSHTLVCCGDTLSVQYPRCRCSGGFPVLSWFPRAVCCCIIVVHMLLGYTGKYTLITQARP